MTQPDDTGATVVIRLAADAASLSGLVQVNNGPEKSFSGWLELMRALEQAREAATASEDHTSPP